MVVNRENLEAVFRNIKLAFQNGMLKRPLLDLLPILVTEFPSTGSSNYYPWMERVPKFRQWVGDRVFNNVVVNKFEVTNVPFEASESISRDDFEDDQVGIFGPIMQMHGEAWPTLLYELCINVLTGNAACFDGKALLANDHAYGENTIDNLVTDALSATSFEAAYAAAASWKFSNGELIRPNFTHLLFGEKLRKTAFNIVTAEKIDNGAGVQIDNPNRGKAVPVQINDLSGTYDDYWYLVDATQPIKAISRQVRRAPVPLMDLDPARLEREGRVDIMASGRAAAAPTFPHLIYGGRL